MKPHPSTISLAGKAAAVLAPAALLAGCMTMPEYKRPDSAPPAQFRLQAQPAAAQSLADLPW